MPENKPAVSTSRADLIQQANDHLVEHGGDVAMALLDHVDN